MDLTALGYLAIGYVVAAVAALPFVRPARARRMPIREYPAAVAPRRTQSKADKYTLAA